MVPHKLSVDFWEEGVVDLLNCLNPWLIEHYETCLVAVEAEPLYSPKSEHNVLHQIQFAHGYFNSALHELAHWCIAGKERRLLPDFGYWYEPDGRTVEQQAMFEKVEIKPQAVEWHFACATGREFRVSVDNLSGQPTDSRPFHEAVTKQALDYKANGLPKRAALIAARLCQSFGRDRDCFQFQ